MEYAVELQPPHRAEHGGRGRLSGQPRSPPTPHAALGGPDWLVAAAARRGRAARRASPGRRPPRRSGATAASTSSTSTATGRPTRRARRPGRRARARRRSGRGRGRRARRARRRAQRPRRAPRARRPARGQGRRASATSRRCDDDDVARRARAVLRRLARRVHACCTTRSSPAARSSRARRASSSSSRSSSCTGREGDGLATFPHTLVVAEESTEVTVARPLRLARHRAAATSSTRSSSWSSATTRPLRYLSVQEHGPHTWQIALQRAHVGRDATLRSSAVALGGDYARLRSESLLTGEGAESDLLAVYFGDDEPDARLPHPPGPRRAAHPQRPAVQGRGRGRGALGVLGPHPAAAERRRRPTPTRPTATSCSPRAPGAESIPNLEIEANDVPLLARERPSARSTTTSSTTSRAAACRPTRPSGSSCSASSTTCSTRLPGARRSARALRRTVVEKIGAPSMGAEVARRARSATSRAGSAQPASTSTATGCASSASATTGTRSATRCSHEDYSLVRGRRVGGRVRDRVPEARLDVLAARPVSRRRCPPPSRCRVYDGARRRRRRAGDACREHADDRGPATPRSTGLEILRGVDLEVALGRGPRAHGPERVGQVDALARADGPRRLRGHRRVGHARRRGAARAAHLAAGRARACSSRCSTRSRCPACASATCSSTRWRAAGRRRTATSRVAAEAERLRGRARVPRPRASTTSSPAARRSASRRCSSRCSRPKFAMLDEIDSGLDVDALRDVSRRIEAMTHRRRPRRARHHPLHPAAHRAAPRPRPRAPGRADRASAAGPSWPTSSRRAATRASRPSSGSTTLTVERPSEADPFADPDHRVEPVHLTWPSRPGRTTAGVVSSGGGGGVVVGWRRRGRAVGGGGGGAVGRRRWRWSCGGGRGRSAGPRRRSPTCRRTRRPASPLVTSVWKYSAMCIGMRAQPCDAG